MSSAIAPELLAPARDFACGKAAIDSGADAVYIAGPLFGAREAAGNDIKEVARLVRYGRRYGVKTYLTLNTLLYPHEYRTARRLAFEAWEAGCSALIIQDPALLESDLPPIPLFASTQMNNRHAEQVQRLARLGFARVILARELSLPQIAAIRAGTSIALESFVHGALCVCYSGQCYLSEHLTGRSANRGTCAQPCRNRYDLADASGRVLVRNQHLLSLRDLCLDTHLRVLMDAGIDSFKIEGRLKNLSYVKNVVAHYRRHLDAVTTGRPKPSLGHSTFSFEPNPDRSFSRGHTLYNIAGNRTEWATIHHAKALGQVIGTIAPFGKRFLLTLHHHVVLSVGDGVCFFNPKGELTGSTVNAIQPAQTGGRFFVELQSSHPVGTDNTLYRNYDRLFEKALAHPRSAKRMVEAMLSVVVYSDSVCLQASIPFGPEVCLTIPCRGTSAAQSEQANLQIRRQLEKMAEGLYLFRVQSLSNHPALFFPAAQINEWRRKLGRALLEASELFFKPQPSTATSLDPQALRALKQHVPPAGTTLKILMQCKYCIRFQMGWCGKGAPQEPLYLVNQGNKLRLEFDCTRCEMKVLKK